MQRTIAVVALAAASVPALALAAGQHPVSSARPNPAASAHAVAAAGEANARRIEACGQVSTAMLAALDKGDYGSATSDFDAQMKALLDRQKLQTAWTSLATQFGKFESQGTPQTLMYDDKPVSVTALRFEKADLAAQVACDANGRVAGFYVRPMGALPASVPAPAPASSR